MQLGLVGLGKMGFNMRARLREDGHEVIGYDPRPEVSDVASLQELADALAVTTGGLGDGAVRHGDRSDHQGTGGGTGRRAIW